MEYFTFSLVGLGNKLALRKMLEIVPQQQADSCASSRVLRVNAGRRPQGIPGRLSFKCPTRHVDTDRL